VNNSREKEKTNSSMNIPSKAAIRVPNLAGRGRQIAQKWSKWSRRGTMFIVKVSWDAHNQQFRLMDQKLAHMFEDGDMYLLVVDFFPRGAPSDDQFIDLDHAEMGHA